MLLLLEELFPAKQGAPMMEVLLLLLPQTEEGSKNVAMTPVEFVL